MSDYRGREGQGPTPRTRRTQSFSTPAHEPPVSQINPRAPAKEILSNVVDGRRAYPVISGSFFHFPIDELNAFDDLSDKLGAPESLPVFLSIGGQLVYHGEGGYA